MNTDQAILTGALIFNLALGITIYWTNPKRGANRQFLILSLTTAAWLSSILLVFRAPSIRIAEFWMRGAAVAGGFLPVAFTLFRLSIIKPELKLIGLLKLIPKWLAIYGAMVIFFNTPAYLVGADIPETGVPNANYGKWAWLFQAYLVGGLLWGSYDFLKSIRTSNDVQRSELQFVLLGLFTFLAIGVFFAGILPLIIKNSQSVSLAPLWVILMDSIIAYGIATRRIMDVGAFIRRAASYGLLLTYLIAIYTIVEYGLETILAFLSFKFNILPRLVGTLAVAFTLNSGRVQNFLQLFINRLFINFQEMNLPDILRTGDSVLAGITTTSDLLTRCKEMLSKAAGTDFVTIYLFSNKEYKQKSSTISLNNFKVSETDPLPLFLKETKKPLLNSLVHRLRSSDLLIPASKQLKELKGTMAIGIHEKEGLTGMVIFGERLSGRIYSQTEQDALQLLINHLTKALENARLYTEVQNAKIYNDILLDNLVSGVIAIDDQCRISVVNREAQRILKKSSQEMIGKTIDCLPKPVGELLLSTLQDRKKIPEQETELRLEDQSICPIRLSGSEFRNQKDELVGALAVLHDISILKELEMYVHHTDRLATIGRLSATMAHEIKNPLVAIKAFTQLLMERGQDKQFIAKFSKIVTSEVERVSRTVTELLGYARVGVKDFREIHVHQSIDQAIGLLKPQFGKKNVQLSLQLAADHDLIQANHDQLQQILVNLLLNAYEAIETDGKVAVCTQITNSNRLLDNTIAEHNWLEIIIKDNGKGILPEDLKRIFDPFFTTKQTGTGLGLSLTYSLVTAHKGLIDVESQLGSGTAFHLFFPSNHI